MLAVICKVIGALRHDVDRKIVQEEMMPAKKKAKKKKH
jgi:hypothetical protein